MTITSTQERDSCLALAFLLLLVWFFTHMSGFVYGAMGVILLGMIWPRAMRPFAIAWFGLASFLGKFTSSILLTLVWVLLVLPVGLIRRWMGRDSLGLKQWRNGSQSCFVIRNHTYSADDLKHPY